MPKMFHLGWFSSAGFGGDAGNWRRSTDGYDWRYPELYQDVARACERAKFDLVFLADTLATPQVYERKSDFYLREGMWAPTHDPIPIMGLMAAATHRIGLVSTISTSFYPPFMAARVLATLDHLSRGRMGWNIVTSVQKLAAQNFGFDDLQDHDVRYDMADEYLALCLALWDSWDADALVMDRESGVFADPTRVRAVNFQGEYYSSRGPLTVSASPQGHPVIISAGSSPRGQRFAAEHAEVTVISKSGIQDMKTVSASLRARLALAGRAPASCKVFALMRPVVGETESIARERWEAHCAALTMETGLATLSEALGRDMSQLDPDQPLPTDFKTNAMRSRLDNHSEAGGPTLREFALQEARNAGFLVRGTPAQIADQLEQAANEADIDGFFLRLGLQDHAGLIEFIDKVVPELQRRGLSRKEYSHAHLRDNLLEF